MMIPLNAVVKSWTTRSLGSISELPLWADQLKADTAIIAIPSASVDAQRRVATMCVRAGVKAMVLPARVLADEEVRRDLRRCVPEYQATMPPKLQSVQSVQSG